MLKVSDSEDKGKTPFDWGALEKLLGGQIPAMLPEPSRMNLRDPSWIGDYVRRLFNQTPLLKDLPAEGGQDSHLFETHKSIIYRISVPKDINPNLIRVWVNPVHLRLEGIYGNQKKQTINLPSPVVPKASKAVLKNNILEVRMLKSSNKKNFREVYVQFEETE